MLAEQAVYQPAGRPVWQIGDLRLTSQRLLFLLTRGASFDIPLTLINAVATESKRFTVVKKLAIAISYRDPYRGSTSKAWFITPTLQVWLERLCELTGLCSGDKPNRPAEQVSRPIARGVSHTSQHIGGTRPTRPGDDRLPADSRHSSQDNSAPPIGQQELERLAGALDPASQEILCHLSLNRHATINDLAALIGAPTHMDVLFRIRQGINPVAEEVLGRPILVFEASKFDRETGEMIPFNWWLAGRVTPVTSDQVPRIEVFNEEHEINVIAELPSVTEEAIRVNVQREEVTVRVEDISTSYHEEIPLPAPVDAGRVVTHFTNGILIVNLQKV